VVDNVQVLHECKDSCDDEYAKHRSRQKPATRASTPLSSRQEGDPFHQEDVDDDLLLQHLLDSERLTQRKQTAKQVDIDIALTHMMCVQLLYPHDQLPAHPKCDTKFLPGDKPQAHLDA
jgi:hypothetical protein